MSTAMQALERMLLSQERREQTRVQESLSMMQMAQTSALQQRQLAMQEQKQNIEVMGANIDLLQKVNKTMKTKSASNFLQASPLGSLYLEYKDEDDGLQSAVKDLTKGSVLLGTDGLELDKEIARDLVAATWSAYEQESPDAIVNLASRLHYIDDTETFQNDYDKKLYKSFQQLGVLGEGADNQAMLNQFKTMKKSLDNEVKLTEEMIEFAKGDYTIDRDFDLISEDLKKLSVDIDPKKKPKLKPEVDTGFESILDLQTAIKYSDSNTSSLNEKKNTILKSIKNLNNSVMMGEAYQNAGIELSGDLKNILSKQNDLKSELDRELKEINKEINDSKNITRKLVSTTEQRRTDIQEKYPLDLIGF
tara:strand:+ start:5956 stop:7044 length:1089 start_codon:yes stop_codon:yes gene_type:complete